MRRWEQVWALWQEGWAVPRIARRLGIDVNQACNELHTAQAYEARANRKSDWERMAGALASAYTDERARAWIYRQMGVEREH